LWSADRRTRLTAQLAALLETLLESPGELVTREELRRRIWPADTEVDFEHGLTAAINRLREALGDSARTPRFIETIPRRGYRWLAAVEVAAEGEARPAVPSPRRPGPATPVGRAPRPGLRRLGWAMAALGLLLAGAVAVWWYRPARAAAHQPPAAAVAAYEEGRFHAALRTDPDLAEAAAHFRHAIALDPAFAEAHAGLALALAQRVYDEFLPPAAAFAEARREAAEALRLGPDLALPHVAMGTVQFQADWDWQGAEVSYRRALGIDANNASALRGLARLLETSGRFDEAIALRTRMVELDPVSVSPRFGLAGSYMDARRFDDVVRVLEPLLANPSPPRTHAFLASAHVARGHCDQALEALGPAEAGRGKVSEDQVLDVLLGWVYASCGKIDEARRVTAEVESSVSRRWVDPVSLAVLYGALGDRDRAFEHLARGVAERSPWAIDLDVDPLLDSLRSDPRFAPIAARVRAGGAAVSRQP
jgi:DNA-binding winged helix-turn-helix (wHTH) protein